MYKKTLLIISGILLILLGILPFPLMFIYSFTQNSDYDFIFLILIAFIVFGIYILYKGIKLKPLPN
jgi:4-amino-4-deoxy-L-arabinose transferase-like glycosyltransferase